MPYRRIYRRRRIVRRVVRRRRRIVRRVPRLRFNKKIHSFKQVVELGTIAPSGTAKETFFTYPVRLTLCPDVSSY